MFPLVSNGTEMVLSIRRVGHNTSRIFITNQLNTYNVGEIAILVPSFDLSYLGTNIHNYGTLIYPIMVI